MEKSNVKILSRKSDLAQIQAKLVGIELEKKFPNLNISYLTKTTEGDIDKKSPLSQMRSTGVFTDDLRKSLIDQELSIITENMKENEKEKNKKENEKNAIKRIKIGLILNEFGEKNKIVVNEDEIKNEIQKQVASMPAQSKQILEYSQKNRLSGTNVLVLQDGEPQELSIKKTIRRLIF